MVRRIYVCSPLHAADEKGIRENMMSARAICRYINDYFSSYRAYAPHAWLPEMLDDNNECERQLGLSFGLELLLLCDIVYVCGDRISEGMKQEIKLAKEMGKQILFTPKLKEEGEGLSL
ncbi:MAG: DUF4406 domain-containing protein [Clostridiales bacterium]|nr:DUF4406 domain-containing protein [Clostridiales bacterium]